MQALKDAGIIVVVILLAVSVRFSPLDETDATVGMASLIPQTEAAPAPAPAPVEHVLPAKAALATTSEEFLVKWVVNGEEMSLDETIESAAVEHCTELMFHIRKAAEETHNETIVIGAEKVIKVLPCSA
jgi:hypothetical protein